MSDDGFEDEASIPSLEQRLAELAPELNALRARLVPELGEIHTPKAKVLWKVLVLYQCLIRRTLELSDGVARAWANREDLTSVLLARALTETAVFTWSITTALRKHVDNGDLGAIDKLIMDRTYATRMASWIEAGLPKADNVLNMIDELDRDMEQHRQPPTSGRTQPVRQHYDLLSDFAHPNWLGVVETYGDLDHADSMFRFVPNDDNRVRLSRTLGVSMNSVVIVEGCLRMLDKLVEPLTEMNRRAPPP